ncbi:MAG: hypothetical protein ACLPTF_03635 [Steroidobacteraceae bacterium]
MRSQPFVAVLCLVGSAAFAGNAGGGAGGGGHGGGAGGAAHGGGGGHAAGPTAGAHMGGGGLRASGEAGGRAAALRVVSIDRAISSGKEVRVATVRAQKPLTVSDRETLLRYGYYKCEDKCVLTYQPKEGVETYCPDTTLSRQRGISMCFRFDYGRAGR